MENVELVKHVNGFDIPLNDAEVEAWKRDNLQPLPEPTPSEIADWQFAGELRDRGIMSQEEAVAFSGRGEIPARLAQLIAGLPEDEQDDTTLLLSGAKTIQRAHPLVAKIAPAFGWDEAATDDFFRKAGAR